MKIEFRDKEKLKRKINELNKQSIDTQNRFNNNNNNLNKIRKNVANEEKILAKKKEEIRKIEQEKKDKIIKLDKEIEEKENIFVNDLKRL